MEKRKFTKELDLSTAIKNTLKEANYKYIYDVITDLYNGELSKKPKVGATVIERIMVAVSCAGWKLLNKNEWKFYIEFMQKFCDDKNVSLYIDSNYYSYEELCKMYKYSVNEIRAIIKKTEALINIYIFDQINNNKTEWWENTELNTREIRTLKLAGIETIEQVKYLVDSNEIYKLEGVGPTTINKLTSILDNKFGTIYNKNIKESKVEVVSIIKSKPSDNNIYKLKLTDKDGSESFYFAETYFDEGITCFNIYQSASKISYENTCLITNEILNYNSNGVIQYA